MKHQYSKEVLYHFQCSECEAWWTIADAQMRFDEAHYISCPICGHKEQAESMNKDSVNSTEVEQIKAAIHEAWDAWHDGTPAEEIPQPSLAFVHGFKSALKWKAEQ